MHCLGSCQKLLTHVVLGLSYNLVWGLGSHEVCAVWILSNLTTFNLSKDLFAKLQKTNFIPNLIFPEKCSQMRININIVLSKLLLEITDCNFALLVLGKLVPQVLFSFRFEFGGVHYLQIPLPPMILVCKRRPVRVAVIQSAV